MSKGFANLRRCPLCGGTVKPFRTSFGLWVVSCNDRTATHTVTAVGKTYVAARKEWNKRFQETS
jgi:hypothetical protein